MVVYLKMSWCCWLAEDSCHAPSITCLNVDSNACDANTKRDCLSCIPAWFALWRWRLWDWIEWSWLGLDWISRWITLTSSWLYYNSVIDRRLDQRSGGHSGSITSGKSGGAGKEGSWMEGGQLPQNRGWGPVKCFDGSELVDLGGQTKNRIGLMGYLCWIELGDRGERVVPIRKVW